MINVFKSPMNGFLVGAVVAVAPTLIIAELLRQPSSQSASQPVVLRNTQSAQPGPATRAGRLGGGGFSGEGRRHLGLGRANQEEMQTAIDFFRENSPNRMSYFAKLAEGSSPHQMAELKLAEAYRPILNFKDSHPELYTLLVQQVQLRDQAFKLARDGNEAELLAKAAEIVPIALKASTLRLEILQKALDDQKARLTEDKANPDTTAEREVAEIKDDEEWWTRPRTPGSGGQSMLDMDPSADPLAQLAPIVSVSARHS